MNYEIKRPLMKVIDKCLLDHAAAVGTKEGGPDIEDVYRLQNLSKIHYYLKEDAARRPRQQGQRLRG